MANSPNDRVQMVHADASEKAEDGNLIPVEVSRHELETLWSTVGWKLQPKPKKEG